MLFIDNKYTRIYFSIIEKSKTSVKTGKTEIHHIIPRCLGGTDEPTNLVGLSLREHFVCHRLLVKMVISTTDRGKLAYACWQMTKRHTVNSRTYEQLKTQLSEATKGIPKSENHKKALRKPKSNTTNMKGGPGRKKGTVVDPSIGRKISAAKKGKNTGSENPFYGKTHSEENKQKWREKFTGVPLKQSHRENISKGLKGRPTWNKGVPNPRVSCCLCRLEVDRSNINVHYMSKKCQYLQSKLTG